MLKLCIFKFRRTWECAKRDHQSEWKIFLIILCFYFISMCGIDKCEISNTEGKTYMYPNAYTAIVISFHCLGKVSSPQIIQLLETISTSKQRNITPLSWINHKISQDGFHFLSFTHSTPLHHSKPLTSGKFSSFQTPKHQKTTVTTTTLDSLFAFFHLWSLLLFHSTSLHSIFPLIAYLRFQFHWWRPPKWRFILGQYYY